MPCKYIPCVVLSFGRSSCAWRCSLPASSRLSSCQARSPPLWGRRFLLYATASDQPSWTASNRRFRHPMLATTQYPSTAFLHLLHPRSTSFPPIRKNICPLDPTHLPSSPTSFPPCLPSLLVGRLTLLIQGLLHEDTCPTERDERSSKHPPTSPPAVPLPSLSSLT